MKKKCLDCNKIFALSTYVVHMKSSSCKGTNEILSCNQCDYTTNIDRNLKKHVKTMHTKREKKFLCDQCDKRFTDIYKLKRHIKFVHEGLKPFKIFFVLSLLKVLIRFLVKGEAAS